MSKKTNNLKLDIVPVYIENAEFDDISTLQWKTLNGVSIANLVETIDKDIARYKSEGYTENDFKFIVSSDSQRHGGKVAYVTTIIFLRQGHGGNAYYLREAVMIPGFINNFFGTKTEKVKRIQSIARNRIWTECTKAVACAKWLDQILINYNLKVKEIHSDVNISKKYLSNELLTAINGYILSQEYIPVVKPYAWGASKIADSKTK